MYNRRGWVKHRGAIYIPQGEKLCVKERASIRVLGHGRILQAAGLMLREGAFCIDAPQGRPTALGREKTNSDPCGEAHHGSVETKQLSSVEKRTSDGTASSIGFTHDGERAEYVRTA